jgi:hypothetical protein
LELKELAEEVRMGVPTEEGDPGRKPHSP